MTEEMPDAKAFRAGIRNAKTTATTTSATNTPITLKTFSIKRINRRTSRGDTRPESEAHIKAGGGCDHRCRGLVIRSKCRQRVRRICPPDRGCTRAACCTTALLDCYLHR